MKKILLLLFFVLLITSASFGETAIEDVRVNNWITATPPSTLTSIDTFNDNFQNIYYYDFAPYYKIYRLRASENKYTIYMQHPGGEYKNILVSGTNPLKGNATSFNSYETQAMESFFMFFQQPYLELPEDNIHTTRVSFSIHPESESRNVYLIAYFNSPRDSFQFMIKSPADPDNEVENDTNNPYAPYLQGHSWGNVHELPLYLSKDNSQDLDTSNTSSNIGNTSNNTVSNYSNLPDDWAKDWIREAISKGLIPSEYQSEYNKPLTRLEFANLYIPVLEKIRGASYITPDIAFMDTESKYPKIAAINRIMYPASNTMFVTDYQLSREEVSFFLYMGIKTIYPYEKPVGKVYFADVTDIEPAFIDSLSYWVGKNVYSKFSDGRVDPKRTMTRQEFYVTLLRIYNIFAK